MVGEGRPSTSLPAKGWIFVLLSDLPRALRLQSKKMDHGGFRRSRRRNAVTPASHSSVHLLRQLRVLRVKVLQSHRPAVLNNREILDQVLANSWMVGLRRP